MKTRLTAICAPGLIVAALPTSWRSVEAGDSGNRRDGTVSRGPRRTVGRRGREPQQPGFLAAQSDTGARHKEISELVTGPVTRKQVLDIEDLISRTSPDLYCPSLEAISRLEKPREGIHRQQRRASHSPTGRRFIDQSSSATWSPQSSRTCGRQIADPIAGRRRVDQLAALRTA